MGVDGGGVEVFEGDEEEIKSERTCPYGHVRRGGKTRKEVFVGTSAESSLSVHIFRRIFPQKSSNF